MENLFLSVHSISLTTSVIIIALIVLGSLINKRYVAKWKYGLWIALALRLLVPVNYTVPDSDFQITVPDEMGSLTVSDIFETEGEVVTAQPADSGMMEPQSALQTMMPQPVEPDIQQKARFSVSLMQALAYLWAVGAICLLIWQLAGYCYCKRRISKRGKQAENLMLSEQLCELCEELGIRKDVTLLIYENAFSPMIIGFWRPILVLPRDEYTPQESYYILKHELIHLKRHDVLVKFLLMLARDIHWFNPIVYLMQREAVVDMELACDEAVVRGGSYDQREAYTETLMSLLHGRQRRGPMLSTQFSGGVRIMKKRFQNILSKANKKNGVVLFAFIFIVTIIIGTLVGCSVEQPIPEALGGEITGQNMAGGALLNMSVGAERLLSLGANRTKDAANVVDVGTDELTINTQLLRYLNITYAQFREQIGTEAEFYHGQYFQAPILGETADVVFQGIYDEEVAGSVLSDEHKSFRIETILNNIISGITNEMTQEMTVAEFMEMLDLHAGFAFDMYPDIQEGLTAYYVAYHYVAVNVDSNGDGILDIQLSIALDEFDHITPDAPTWIYESAFFEDSEQDIELSEHDAELIDMGIHNNEHNVYLGSLDNEEIRMMITRTEGSLSAAYITRDGKVKAFQGNLKKDSAGFILNADSGGYLEGTISADDNGQISISGAGVLSGKDIVFTLRQDTFFQMGEDTKNYYSSIGYEAKDVEQFTQQIKDSVNDKAEFVKLISYPISIEIDGSSISIENEEEMLDIYDKLIEQNGFRQQIENVYTKFMFANYMGICVEDGIMWINIDSSGNYKITAINPRL